MDAASVVADVAVTDDATPGPTADAESPDATVPDAPAPDAKGDASGSDIAGECTSDADCAPLGTVCAPARCDDGACVTSLADGVSCDDEDPCTEDDTCAAGVCLGSLRSRDDGNPCTDDDCSESGCIAEDNGTCACTVPADCAAHEDGDLCSTRAPSPSRPRSNRAPRTPQTPRG